MNIKSFGISLAVTTALSFGFSGCSPSFESHQPTINYAKKHKIQNKDYNESEIMCISDKPLTKKDRDEIFLFSSARYHSDYTDQECTSSYISMINSPGGHNGGWGKTYKRCLNNVYESISRSETIHFKRYTDKAYKIEFRHYDGIYPVSRLDKSDLDGYLGFNEINGKTIVYVADVTNQNTRIKRPSKIGFIKEGVMNYMKKYPNKCQAFEK